LTSYNNTSADLYKRKIKKLVMENLDLIIFSIILVVLFILFGIGTIAEFNRMSNEPFDAEKDKGGIVSLKNFTGKILVGSNKKS
jgi:hypothetical protein